MIKTVLCRGWPLELDKYQETVALRVNLPEWYTYPTVAAEVIGVTLVVDATRTGGAYWNRTVDPEEEWELGVTT